MMSSELPCVMGNASWPRPDVVLYGANLGPGTWAVTDFNLIQTLLVGVSGGMSVISNLT